MEISSSNFADDESPSGLPILHIIRDMSDYNNKSKLTTPGSSLPNVKKASPLRTGLTQHQKYPKPVKSGFPPHNSPRLTRKPTSGDSGNYSGKSRIKPLPGNLVRAAIESASPIMVGDLEQRLRTEFPDVLEKPVYAKDIDPAIRGPFGVARIELKDGAKPMHKKFFRCSGEREEALNDMIKKLIDRGWVVPSTSEWTSQAFVTRRRYRKEKVAPCSGL